jgi:pimeloyl-ACP methyl ester carboxylesterase
MRYEAWRASGQRVRLLGRDAFVRISGQGPALLFLHGFPTSSYDWSACIEHLEARHRCVAFDFWGFGDSDPLGRYDYDQQTELALAVAAHAGVERAVVVAHDYGVSVAEELVARRPEALALDGVVYLNGGIEPALHRPIAIQRVLASPLGAVLAPLVLRKTTLARSMARLFAEPGRFDVDEHWSAMSARGAHLRTHALLHYIAERKRRRGRWVQAFCDRQTPIALAWGLVDPISGAHVLEWAKQARPDADVLALPVGHYPQLEAPAEVAALIARFTAEVRLTHPQT